MNNKEFQYLRRESKRARRLSLSVYPDGRIALTVPPQTSERTIARFLREHEPWVQKQLSKIDRREKCIFLPGGRRDYLKNKERARKFVQQILTVKNRYYNLEYGRIAIKNMYRNWGSCSAKRNLNFNYKLIHLPSHLGEYIVVHELCHLREMNHSKEFWQLVARTVPDHKSRRKELRKYLM